MIEILAVSQPKLRFEQQNKFLYKISRIQTLHSKSWTGYVCNKLNLFRVYVQLQVLKIKQGYKTVGQN